MKLTASDAYYGDSQSFKHGHLAFVGITQSTRIESKHADCLRSGSRGPFKCLPPSLPFPDSIPRRSGSTPSQSSCCPDVHLVIVHFAPISRYLNFVCCTALQLRTYLAEICSRYLSGTYFENFSRFSTPFKRRIFWPLPH